MTEAVDQNFESLLEYLRQNRGFDFTGYKRPSLMRRVSKRMQDIHIDAFEDYVDYLEVHPEEFSHLFDTILINVTAFFRDTTAWEYFAQRTKAIRGVWLPVRQARTGRFRSPA